MKNSDLFKGVYFCQIYEKGNKPNKYYYLFMIFEAVDFDEKLEVNSIKKANEYSGGMHWLCILFKKGISISLKRYCGNFHLLFPN